MQQAIGVIDSGIGGFTVTQELMRQLPNERIIYLGDTARCPYGPRPAADVQTYTQQMAAFLMSKHIKMLIIACNTATAFTLDLLQTTLPIPVLGVIQPGTRAAIKRAQTDHVAVIGTEGTIASGAYRDALKIIKPSIRVDSLACPEFVPLVEQGKLSDDYTKQVVRNRLRSFKNQHQRFDTLILGCTHYPLLKPLIQDVMGPDISIISSSEETARETSVILSAHGLLNEHPQASLEHEFYTTGDADVFTSLINIVFSNTTVKTPEQSAIKQANIADDVTEILPTCYFF